MNTVRVSKIGITPEILMAAVSCGEPFVYIVYSLHSDKAEVCSFSCFTVFGLPPAHLLFSRTSAGLDPKSLSFSQAPQCTRFQPTFGPASPLAGTVAGLHRSCINGILKRDRAKVNSGTRLIPSSISAEATQREAYLTPNAEAKFVTLVVLLPACPLRPLFLFLFAVTMIPALMFC